jgi:hypothetical protein
MSPIMAWNLLTLTLMPRLPHSIARFLASWFTPALLALYMHDIVPLTWICQWEDKPPTV